MSEVKPGNTYFFLRQPGISNEQSGFGTTELHKVLEKPSI